MEVNAQTIQLTCHVGNDVALNEVKVQKVYTNITIPQTNRVKGYLEHLPSNYNPLDVNKKYPLILNLQVKNEWGNGTPEDMCKFFGTRYQQFPHVRIELGTWPTTLPLGNGQSTPFITLTPQFTVESYSTADIDNFLTYAKSRYNVDPNRVYLMGASMGANAALQFIGSSEANAKKIAGIIGMSPCMVVNSTQAQNIKNGGSAVWLSQCYVDNLCDGKSSERNYNALKAAGVPDYKNVWSNLTQGNGCVTSNEHESWTLTTSPNFTFSTLSTPMNIYQWMGSLSSNTILPVTLKSFDAKLVNQQAWLQWETAQEENGEFFYIQRANDEMRFTTIDSVLTKNFAGGSKYQYIDPNPSIGNNYYRLLQKDVDGNVQVFEIKKIALQTNSLITLLHNPFYNTIKFSVQSSIVDQYQFVIRDLQGKTYHNEKLMITVGKRDYEVNAGNWPSGMYLLSIQTSNGIQTYKLIKN